MLLVMNREPTLFDCAEPVRSPFSIMNQSSSNDDHENDDNEHNDITTSGASSDHNDDDVDTTCAVQTALQRLRNTSESARMMQQLKEQTLSSQQQPSASSLFTSATTSPRWLRGSGGASGGGAQSKPSKQGVWKKKNTAMPLRSASSAVTSTTASSSPMPPPALLSAATTTALSSLRRRAIRKPKPMNHTSTIATTEINGNEEEDSEAIETTTTTTEQGDDTTTQQQTQPSPTARYQARLLRLTARRKNKKLMQQDPSELLIQQHRTSSIIQIPMMEDLSSMTMTAMEPPEFVTHESIGTASTTRTSITTFTSQISGGSFVPTTKPELLKQSSFRLRRDQRLSIADSIDLELDDDFIVSTDGDMEQHDEIRTTNQTKSTLSLLCDDDDDAPTRSVPLMMIGQPSNLTDNIVSPPENNNKRRPGPDDGLSMPPPILHHHVATEDDDDMTPLQVPSPLQSNRRRGPEAPSKSNSLVAKRSSVFSESMEVFPATPEHGMLEDTTDNNNDEHHNPTQPEIVIDQTKDQITAARDETKDIHDDNNDDDNEASFLYPRPMDDTPLQALPSPSDTARVPQQQQKTDTETISEYDNDDRTDFAGQPAIPTPAAKGETMEGAQPQSPEATTASAEPPSQLKLRQGKIFASKLAFQHVFPPGCNGDATFDTIDLTEVSLQSVRKKSFTATNNSFMITYAHSVDYKGERIWHCTSECRGDAFSNIGTTTCCMLTTDRLRVIQLTKSRSWLAAFDGDTKIRDEYDVLQMLLSSAELYIAENGIDSLARRSATTTPAAISNDTTASSTTPASSPAITTTTRGDLFLKRLKKNTQNIMSRRRRSSRLSRMSTDSSVAFVLRSVPDEEEDASLEFIE